MSQRSISSLPKTAAFVALLFLANCASYDIEELRTSPRTGSEFARVLADEYQTFAQMENAKENEEQASHFAVKGLQAAAGEDVSPENPNRWDIPKDQLPDLMHKRHQLMTVMIKSGRRVAPRPCAAAQVAYDCLVETAQGCQCKSAEMYKMCQTKFHENLMAAEKAVQVVAPNFTVYFSHNAWDLNAENTQMVKEAARLALEDKMININVTGFTDAQGGRKSNLILSQKRAEAVARALVNCGIEATRISAVGEGEVPGFENMPKHRKVIIHLY